MSITDRQKKIINPYAETLDTPGRRGVGYDYNNRRNRFVQDAIQERYIYFFQFPQINETLRVKTEDVIENPQIQEADLLAYFATYPQNGKVVNGEAVEIGDDEALLQLQTLARQLTDNNVIDKYTSKTSEVSYLEEYQSRLDVADLIAIPAGHSNAYRNKLREAFALPSFQYSGEAELNSIYLSPRSSTYVLTDTNVDLYDWRQNCLPGDKDKIYYNTVDRNYYFTRRTDEVGGYLNYSFNEIRSYFYQTAEDRQAALSIWNNVSQTGKNLYINLVNEAIKEILQSTGKFSDNNYQRLVEKYSAPNNFVLYTNKGFRPGSRWTYAVKINGQDIENLPSPESINPSLEETEISTLEKAKRIISDANQSANSIQFQVEDLIRYIFYTRNLLREYDKKLFDLNLNPQVLNGIDLGKEVDRLNSLFSLLELFYNYNKIALQDSDFVEMYFTEDYRLDHVVVNGSFYYQGTGQRTYLNEETESTRVINAFGIFTPTTFSIVQNCQQIYDESKNASNDNQKDVLEFMTEYLFPKIDLDMIKRDRAAVSELEKQRAARRKKIFETYSKLTKGNPEEFEFFYSNRPLRYTISSTLSNMNCDSGQAAAAQYALKFWQAWGSKTRVQSIIRQAIILLRDEAVEDETLKRRLTQGANYAQNPDRVSRDIEKYINEQIFCSLDVVGDFIEDQFLDPLGLPPEVNRLTRNTIDSGIPKFEFKKCSMTSAKARKSVLYQKMLETILLNFCKSIVAGMAKDLINALLGCGPEDPENELANNFRKEDYGFVNLTELLYGIDIVGIAEIVGIKNVEERVVDGNTITERTDPTKVQLEALISDISKMCTPIEIQQLLNGDGSNDLMEHILETVKGNKDIDTSSIDVDVYNMMNLDVDRIRNYFLAIGNALDGTLDDLGNMGFLSPLEAYCSKKDGFINPLTLDFSIPEIEAQYNDIINSKIAKINNFCNFLRDFTNIELEIQRLIDSLPVLDWYNDLLQDIADFSNYWAEYIAGKFANLFGRQQTTRQQPEYNLYNSQMGTELFYQIFFSLREVLINQLFFIRRRGEQTKTYFQTPAGFSQNRIGFVGSISENWFGEDDRVIQGNFGGRKNQDTRNNVYKFIWSDPRTANYVSPSRINLPQYRNPIVPPSDVFDASYYSLRNSPEPLVRRLQRSPNLLSPDNVQKIQYGQPRSYSDAYNYNRLLEGLGNLGLGEDNSESNYLLIFANRVYDYLKQVENRAPYEGWTGATYLRCSNDGDDGIKIFYNTGPSGELEEISSFRTSENYNEVSDNSEGVSIDENNYDLIDYRIYNGIEFEGSNISVSNSNTLTIDDVQMPILEAGGTANLYGNLSIGLLSDIDEDQGQEFPLYDRYKDIYLFQNYTTRIDSMINNSVINETGKRRMPRYIAALNKTALQKTDDICVTAEDILKGEAGLKKVQANMFSFFMNIMPMASAYPNWRSGGTVEMITDYLTRRFIEDLKEKQILGSFYELIPYIRMVYPHVQGDEEFNKNPIILDELSPTENTRSIIKAVYVGILDKISETSEYPEINRSTFDPSIGLNRYKKLLGNFYRKLYETGDDLVNYLQTQQRENPEAARRVIRTLYTGDNASNSVATDKGVLVGTYYFPVAFQIASYMMYMDRGIRYSERYVDTNYRMLLEEAATDDGMLTAIKGELVEQFTPEYLNFPTVIEGWNDIPVRYFNSRQAERRIKELRQLVGSLDTSEGFREFGYLPLYDPQNQYSLLRLGSSQLLEVFPDFWSPEALLDAPPLYPDRETPTLDQVTQDGGISSLARYQVATWLNGLRRLFLDQNDRLRVQTKARAQFRTPGSSYGNGYTSYPFTGPPNNNPAGQEDYLYNAIQANLRTDENPNDGVNPDQLRNLFQARSRMVVQKIIEYNNQFGAESYTLEPTIRTNDQYFESLGEIFRDYSTPVYSPEVAQSLINNPLIPEITAGTQLYPYFIRSKQVGISYLYNYSYGIAYKFFNQYLYSKYFNYRTDKAKLLEEINQLEKLINRNE
jgi:hypothetical protein